MSADNFLGILKCKDGKYRGYNLSASVNYTKKSKHILNYYYMTPKEIEEYYTAIFTTKKKKKAIKLAIAKCEEDYYEYGFDLLNF